jgi:hypothetical protein
LEKDRIAAIKQGKGASKAGREFARKPFTEAAKAYLEERQPQVRDATFGETALLAVKSIKRGEIGPLSRL